MTSRTFYAKDVVFYPKEKLYSFINDRRPITLIFDDGEIQTDWHQTIVSYMFWEYHRKFPATKLPIKMHVYGERFGTGLQKKLCERGKKLVLETYPNADEEYIDYLTYRITDLLHNFSVEEIESWNISIDSRHLLEIIRHPEIIKARQEFGESNKSIKQAYTRAINALKFCPTLDKNHIANVVRAGQPKEAQLVQILVGRGRASEIDKHLFKHVINASFSEGLQRLSFIAMERCSGSKALMAQEEPVKLTEYANREIQLQSYLLKGVDVSDIPDCGSKEYVPWEVTREDLEGVITGTYYFDENMETKEVKVTDKHLIGKTIKMRTMFYCHHPAPDIVCLHCAGALAKQIQRNTSLGYALTVTVNEPLTQSVISTKHLLSSAIRAIYEIDPYYRPYINNDFDDGEISFSSDLVGCSIKMVLNRSDMRRIHEIKCTEDIYASELSNISAVKEVKLLIDDGSKKIREVIVPLGKAKMYPYISEELHQYMLDYGTLPTEKDDEVMIDLVNWDDSGVLFKLPERHDSADDFMKEFKSVIFMTNKKRSNIWLRMNLRNPENLALILREMSDFANQRFTVNLLATTALLYCMSCRNPTNADYRLPAKGTDIYFGTFIDTIKGRSLSAKLAHERQYDVPLDPLSYVITNRPDHPFDSLFVNKQEWMQKQW